MSDLYTGVRHLRGRNYYVLHDVSRGSDKNRVEFTVMVMRVYEHERDLDQGRFAHYSHDAQEFAVPIQVNGTAPWVDTVAQFVNWIAEHAEHPWNLKIDVHNVQEATMTFTFSDLTAATMFKLVFG